MMGVTFDQEKKQFLFDFTHDNECDVVKLTGEIQQVEAFGKCFYYGYEFTDQIEVVFSLIGRKDLMADSI